MFFKVNNVFNSQALSWTFTKTETQVLPPLHMTFCRHSENSYMPGNNMDSTNICQVN